MNPVSAHNLWKGGCSWECWLKSKERLVSLGLGWNDCGYLKHPHACMRQHCPMVKFVGFGARALSSNSNLATYCAPAIDLYPVCLEIFTGYLPSLRPLITIILATKD